MKAIHFSLALLAVSCNLACNDHPDNSGAPVDSTSKVARIDESNAKKPRGDDPITCLKTKGGEDSLDLKSHPETYKQAVTNSKFFIKTFRPNKTDAFTGVFEKIPKDKLLELQQSYLNNPPAGSYIRGLIVHYGITGKATSFTYQPAFCTTGESGATRTYKIDKTNKKLIFDGKNFVEDKTTRIAEYQNKVWISRDGSGSNFTPFSDNAGNTESDNARSVFFPFQEIIALFEENKNETDLDLKNAYFFCGAKTNVGVTRHHVNICLRDISNDHKIFKRMTANLGSLCPVNCSDVSFRLVCQ